MTIFVVDDDPAMLDAMTTRLRSVNMAAFKFQHRTSALNAGCFGLRPDIVIVDWCMPGIRLDSFTAQFRSIHPGVIFILSTGTSVFDAHAAREAGITLWIHKCSTDDEFANVLGGLSINRARPAFRPDHKRCYGSIA